MTITESFIDYIESQGIATLGQDLFLRRLPSSLDIGAPVYWIIPNGGYSLSRNKTGERIKLYSYLINCRGKSEEVENKLFELESIFSESSCVEFEGYEIVNIEVTSYSTDADTDAENREEGFIQVNIQTYKKGY